MIMSVDHSKFRKSSLLATILFAIVFVIYSYFFVSDIETSTTGKNWQRGILAGLFGALSIMNYLKYKRAKP
jgi:membrane protein DedA with SNARE-associated domain